MGERTGDAGPLRPRLHRGVFAFARRAHGEGLEGLAGLDVVATMREAEGLTLVLPLERAQAAGLEVLHEAAWITLETATALDAVGLTARFAAALAAAGISCNVIAGASHDHVFVGVARAEEARRILAGIEWGAADGS
ncbi:MAG: ACT domain-containing protein [Planctomycetota bacterium]|nr:ACT domain-containing protein [Planctomycetota bacterium]